ncbi:nuclear transport factor 2 family protein [Rhizobium mesoamericanum]|uniref:nuclear transport factor 2 family protein n=1 Tax=Rhizobium mesoamericanum TaxID=1079800 RepID=UPI0003F53C83|nr:ester cyclase [Rhizobium mesoamericanum]
MGRRNLDHMRAIDAAWNRRQWADYATHFEDGLIAWISGEAKPHGKAEHLLRAQQFCAAYPDARVDEDYLDLFLSIDGQTTCSVALLKGTAGSQAFRTPFAVICKWRDGRVVEQREFFDHMFFNDQPGPLAVSKGDDS